MVKRSYVQARQVLNNRCEWTIEAEIDGGVGRAPSGASTGQFEAHTLPVADALAAFQQLQPEMAVHTGDQEQCDTFLQEKGGDQFAKIGSNTAIALSFALYNRDFSLTRETFPVPLGNVFGGKRHGGYTDIQEFLILPWRAQTMEEAIQTMIRFYGRLQEQLGNSAKGTNDEGALIANITDVKALDMLSSIAEDLDVGLGVDIAASELFDGARYVYEQDTASLDRDNHFAFIEELITTYDLRYVEDPFDEQDFAGFAQLRRKCSNTLVCGDDLTVTNTERMQEAQQSQSVNSVIIKPNQIGTVSLAQQAVAFANAQGWTPVISHRSGETVDATIARLAVNWKIPIIKCGIAGMRTVKLNELLRLWEQTTHPKMCDVL